jgi:hypothetical protein
MVRGGRKIRFRPLKIRFHPVFSLHESFAFSSGVKGVFLGVAPMSSGLRSQASLGRRRVHNGVRSRMRTAGVDSKRNTICVEQNQL